MRRVAVSAKRIFPVIDLDHDNLGIRLAHLRLLQLLFMQPALQANSVFLARILLSWEVA